MLRNLRLLDPNVRIFLAGEALFALGQGVVSLLLNLHWTGVGFSPVTIGALVSMGSAIMALLAIPAGALAGRLGRLRLLVGGTALIALGIVLATLPSRPAVFAGQALAAVGWMAVLVIEFPVVMSYARAPDENVTIFSLVVGTFTLFLGLGTLGAGWLPTLLRPLSAAAGATTIYQIPLVLGGLLIGGTSVVRLRMRVAEQVASAAGPASMRPDPLILRLTLPAVLSGFAFGCVAPFMNLIMAQRFGSGEAMIGLVLTVGGLTFALGSAVAPRAAARVGEVRAIRAALLLNTGLGVLMAAPVPLAVFAGLHWLRSATYSAGANVIEGRMFSAVPDDRRALYGGYRTVGTNLGQTAAGALVGWLLAAGAEGVPFLLGAGAVLAYATYYLTAVLPIIEAGPSGRAEPRAAVVE